MSRTIRASYFLSDDCDNEKCPNVYSIPVPTQAKTVTLAEITKHFPLPGAYYFSSKKIFNGQTVWVDLVDDKQKVLIEDGYINLKISRIGLLSNINASQSANTTPIHRPTSPLFTTFNTPNSAPQPSFGNDLLDFGDNSNESSNQANPLTRGDSFDMFLNDSMVRESGCKSPSLEKQLESLNWSVAELDIENKMKSKQNKVDKEKGSNLKISSSKKTLESFLKGPSVSLKKLANNIEIGC